VRILRAPQRVSHSGPAAFDTERDMRSWCLAMPRYGYQVCSFVFILKLTSARRNTHVPEFTAPRASLHCVWRRHEKFMFSKMVKFNNGLPRVVLEK
jgi:hypothetical protein